MPFTNIEILELRLKNLYLNLQITKNYTEKIKYVNTNINLFNAVEYIKSKIPQITNPG